MGKDARVVKKDCESTEINDKVAKKYDKVAKKDCESTGINDKVAKKYDKAAKKYDKVVKKDNKVAGQASQMTKERLDCLRSLRREIARTKRRIALIENSLDKCDEKLAQDISTAKIMLEIYLQKAQQEENEIINYINQIDEPFIREIFMLRYVDGVRSWLRIAFMAGEHDESYIRRKHNAYLKKTKGEK